MCVFVRVCVFVRACVDLEPADVSPEETLTLSQGADLNQSCNALSSLKTHTVWMKVLLQKYVFLLYISCSMPYQPSLNKLLLGKGLPNIYEILFTIQQTLLPAFIRYGINEQVRVRHLAPGGIKVEGRHWGMNPKPVLRKEASSPPE